MRMIFIRYPNSDFHLRLPRFRGVFYLQKILQRIYFVEHLLSHGMCASVYVIETYTQIHFIEKDRKKNDDAH